MKKSLFYLPFCLLMAVGCNKAPKPSIDALSPAIGVEMGTLTIDLDFSDDRTKATAAYVESEAYESAVNSVQVLVFSASNGVLDAYESVGATTSGIQVNCLSGNKNVCALVNGPDLSACKTYLDFRKKASFLTDNSLTTDKGFLMTGIKSCTVTSEGTTCSVAVHRQTARVAVQSITNNVPAAYGDISIQAIWLSNTVFNSKYDITCSESEISDIVYINKLGRSDENPQVKEHILDGQTYLATCPDLTFKKLNQSVANGATHTPTKPYLLYCMPNSSTNSLTPFSTVFTPQHTAIVVKALVNGTVNYYPVPLNFAVKENTAYTLALTITGFGSDDPNVPVQKGNLGVSISVTGWFSGNVLDVII